MQTHYPDYDVMNAAEAWDDHTREIVKKRLESAKHFGKLSFNEAQLVSTAAEALVDDNRQDLLDFITHHLDQMVVHGIGEGERKAGTPPQAVLIIQGLAAIEATAQSQYRTSFTSLSRIQRQTLLGRIERAELPNSGLWQGIPQPEFFKMLLSLVVEAYYSHPAVWSEIGYGGPAYPRGYVRTELDRIDPWEAKLESGSPHQRSSD